MKYSIVMFLFAITLGVKVSAQKESAFQEGEWFKFEMNYSGFLKAGEATLEVKNR